MAFFPLRIYAWPSEERAPGTSVSRWDVKSVQIQGRKYDYIDEGTGICVFLIHGGRVASILSTSKGIWDRQIDVLVTAGYRVVCPYRAGMGGSEIVEPMTHAKDTADMWALLDKLGLERVVVGGHSAGAYLTVQMLLQRPHRVKAAVLFDGGYYLAGAASKLGPDRMTRTARAWYERYRQEFEALRLPWVYHSEFNLREYQEWNRMDAAFIERVERRPEPRDLPATERIHHPLPERFHSPVPMLVFASGWGKILQNDPEAAALKARLLPPGRTTLHVVTESGHWVQIEQAEFVNSILLEFLDEVGSRLSVRNSDQSP